MIYNVCYVILGGEEKEYQQGFQLGYCWTKEKFLEKNPSIIVMESRCVSPRPPLRNYGALQGKGYNHGSNMLDLSSCILLKLTDS